ncbi:MAG: amidase [Clostridia bacterium]|nr:amidase [Clostridia bacterium]
MEKLELLSAAELGREIQAGHLTPTEAVLYFEHRIEERNAAINAFVYTKFEEAEAAAKALEQSMADGEEAGPFAGVPFALKDFLPSKKGWTHSHGGVKSLIREDPVDSEFCKAMEAAGGIALGKTNAPAFGFRGATDNKLYGPTRNPYDHRYNAGGSSGGSAAAVADGLVPIAEGGDAGGSIRIPAAWCNLVGFKASVGTVPSVIRPDAWSATHPYCCNGGLTKTVEDAAILLNYMARFDPRDPLSRYLGPKDFTELMGRSVKGWRVAWTPDFGIFPVDPEVAKRTEQTALLLKEAGAIVEPVEFHLPRTAGEYGEIWCRSISVDTAIELDLDRRNGFDLIKDHRDELPEEFIYWNEQAARGGILDYYEFNRARTELLDAQQDVFDRYDILLSPTSTCLPVRNADDRNTKGPTEVNGTPVDPLIGFAETFLFNFTGNPAASVPAGFSQSGLPVGLQVIGKRFRDEDVLTVARTLEQLRS